jgi:HTH-type transcriptional regulator, pleiotropic regulator of extracellular virulence genes
MQDIHFQRNEPDDNPESRKRIAQLQADLGQTNDDTTKLSTMLKLGEWYRAVGEYAQAAGILHDGLSLARHHGNVRYEVAMLISLATTRQYSGERVEAMRLFREALEKSQAPGCNDYTDFVWQHMGKCLVELDEIDEAISCFESAYALRAQKGDPELLASTQRALEAARSMANS